MPPPSHKCSLASSPDPLLLGRDDHTAFLISQIWLQIAGGITDVLMLISFSSSPIRRIWAIYLLNKWNIFAFSIISGTIVALHQCLELTWLELPAIPVSVLGAGLAIFLAFRNNSAYDRWWEARKIWGGVVNTSRSLGTSVLSLSEAPPDQEAALNAWQKALIYRHLAWINALRVQLRRQQEWDFLDQFVDAESRPAVDQAQNKAAMLLHLQGLALGRARQLGYVDSFQQVELNQHIKELYNLQGMCERIKNTVFPYYYAYFTRMFLWIFIAMLPMAMVKDLEWITIPVTIAVALVFTILEKAGGITENPFQGMPGDTPMSTICRGIEIDLRQQLQETDIPTPLTQQMSRWGAAYLE
jgi:ion channel-forming bestrophin family protein